MNKREEIEFNRKAEKHFKSQRETPNGRDYRCFRQRDITEEERDSYRENFDVIFPDAPGNGF